jgi:hypothetical protein
MILEQCANFFTAGHQQRQHANLSDFTVMARPVLLHSANGRAGRPVVKVRALDSLEPGEQDRPICVLAGCGCDAAQTVWEVSRPATRSRSRWNQLKKKMFR